MIQENPPNEKDRIVFSGYPDPIDMVMVVRKATESTVIVVKDEIVRQTILNLAKIADKSISVELEEE